MKTTIDLATLIDLRNEAHRCQFKAIERRESRSVIAYFEGKFEAYSKMLELMLGSEATTAPASSEATDAPPPRSDERAYESATEPAPSTIRVHFGISDHSEAVMDIHIAEDGLGAIDQPTKREPTAREMDLIARAMRGSSYLFHSTLI